MNKTAIIIASALIGAHASAATVLIDFGRTGATATTAYNNVGDATPLALNDISGSASGWIVTVSNTGNGGFGQAGAGADVFAYPPELASFEATALQDSLFSNAGTGTASMTVSLSNLELTSTYDLLFYGSRSNGQNITQTWTLTQGLAASPVTHQSLANSTTVVNWTNLVPTAGGIIEFTLTGPPATGGALALNFGSITSIPEPSSLLLLGAAGLGLALRRRR